MKNYAKHLFTLASAFSEEAIDPKKALLFADALHREYTIATALFVESIIMGS
jgi:hypothetical protein